MVVIGRCSSNECPDKENEHTHDTVDRGAYRYPFSSMGLVTARTHETPVPEMEEIIRCEKVLAIGSNPHRYLVKRTGRINNEWEPAAEVPQWAKEDFHRTVNEIKDIAYNPRSLSIMSRQLPQRSAPVPFRLSGAPKTFLAAMD
jgi:hypothetical protein